MKKTLLLVAALLALTALDARAQLPPLKMTETKPDGTVTTSEISGSFAFQTFGALMAPSQMLAGTAGVSRRYYLGFADKAGNVFTLGPAGEVYRNGVRLFTTSSTGTIQKMLAEKLVSFGNEIYALGKTNATWYRWDGTAAVNKWVQLPVDFDVSILN